MTNELNKTTVKPASNFRVVERCDDLIMRRELWEQGAYKASNDQLYDILASAYELYMLLVKPNSTSERKTFVNVLKAKGVSYQTNTPLHTRVIRLVFAMNRQRSYTYGRVLLAARREAIDPAHLPNWIRDNHGVEEVKVKSNGKLTPTEKAKADAEYAADILAGKKAMLALGKVPADLKPDPEHNPIYSLALVRCDDGAVADIVWGTSNEAAIAKVLALAGKKLRADATAQAERKAKRQAKQSGRMAISTVASAQGQRAQRPGNMAAYRSNPSLLHSSRVLKLLHECRIWVNLESFRSR